MITLEQLKEPEQIRSVMRNKQRSLIALETRLTAVNQPMTGMPGARGNNKMEVLMAEYIDRKEELQELQDHLDHVCDALAAVIRKETAGDDYTRLILEMHYLYGLNWENTAKGIGPGYSSDAIRMHVTRWLTEIKEN